MNERSLPKSEQSVKSDCEDIADMSLDELHELQQKISHELGSRAAVDSLHRPPKRQRTQRELDAQREQLKRQRGSVKLLEKKGLRALRVVPLAESSALFR